VGGAVVGAAVVGAAVGATVGASVDGGGVLVRMAMLDDPLALDVGEGELDAGARLRTFPRTSTPITSSVSSAPATAASARSIHRGPRGGGGMSFVVSPATPAL
jgi:hypothetical protein